MTIKNKTVVIRLFECIFNGSESITHFMGDFDLDLYDALPNCYAICIADKGKNSREIPAGLIIKTHYTHDDPEFLDAITAAVAISENLSHFVRPAISFLPAKLGILPGPPPTEAEMTRVMLKQHFKHVSATAV